MVKEMTHPLTIFSPDQVVTPGGFKCVRISPSTDDCNLHREAYSVRMGDFKMEWQDFENTAEEVKNGAGVQLVQFKALPVGLEKEVLEEIVIQKGFIVIAWTLERQTYADGKDGDCWISGTSNTLGTFRRGR